MNLDQLKNKLNALQSDTKGGGKKQKNQNKWKPPVGKATIRVLPSVYNEENPFTELYVYYGIDKKTILSPKCYGEKDPIEQFIKQLRKSNDKESWVLAKKLEAKMRTFLPIIVRGEEEKGVKLWEFGKLIYMDLLSLIDNEDIGDFTDIAEGFDIVVTTIDKASTGTDFNKSTIMPRVKSTPIAPPEQKEDAKKWLTEQPNPIDNYKKYSFDEIKEALQNYLSPEDESEPTDEEESESPFKEQPSSLSKPEDDFVMESEAPVKKSKDKKFDELFKED